MKTPASLSTPRAAIRRQQGAALIITMILLMTMTLLAITGLRGASQQERMSANAYDRDLAFQAAEAALRAGEIKAAELNDADFPASACTCSNGLCAPPGNTCPTPWNTSGNFVDVPVAELDIEAANTPQRNPQYMIEKLGPGLCASASTSASTCQNFRITAKSDNDGDGRGTVILQSIYAK
ncbi:MAG: pilus assembly protein [Azoarcus sp.]|jgi:type IV pilus assembly protein PilX|nr:pilus assembly protein [Azoarcus sp.]